MKKTIAIVSLILALLFVLASCGRGNKFVADGVTFVDKKTDIVYNFAPFCYEPLEIEEEIYGSDGDIDFHRVVGQDPEKWLAETDGGLFYAEGVTLPKLDELEISRLEICTVSKQLLVKKRVTDSEQISKIIDSYMNDNGYFYPNTSPELYHKLRFADSARGIYYCLDFMRYEKDYIVMVDGKEKNLGRDFVYNRSEDRFIPAPDVLVDIIDGRASDSQEA